MMAIEINAATIIVGIIVIALVLLAIRRLRTKGLCDCKDCPQQSSGCKGCSSVDKMLADMEQSSKLQ